MRRMPRASNVVDVNGTIVVEEVPHDDILEPVPVAATIAAMVNEKDDILVSLDNANLVKN
jgi:hypothetical protein